MLGKKVKAAILHKLKSDLILDDIQLPESLDYGQVLVKVLYSGICGSQIGEINGVKGEDKYLPHLLGHEGSAEVIECGPGVTHVDKGDTVIMHWRKGNGIEAKPPKYKWDGQTLNAGFVTTFNEYAVVSENRLTRISDDFPLKIAPLFGCAVTTGLGVICNNAQLKIGQSALIYGAGGVGLNIIQAAKMASGYPIIAVDIYDHKLEVAKKFGATHCINAKTEDVEAEVAKIVGGQGVDVVIENTGNIDVVSSCYTMTHNKGKLILVGVPKAGEKISFYSLPIYFGKTITGSHGGESNPSIDIPNYIKLYENGRLQLDDLITNEFEFSEINTAISKMVKGEIAGRCMLKITG